MKDVIIALDFKDAHSTLAFLDLFAEQKPFVKVGMELFYAEGPQIVRQIKARGHQIFLDLKLHDIPNTVQSAMRSLATLEPDMIDLHAAGTIEMMKAAVDGFVSPNGKKPLIIAITQLTSTSEEALAIELLIPETMENTVIHYANNAKQAGLDGIVCSPLEAAAVKAACGNDFITVTPGVRPVGSAVGDQVRFTTPAKAREIGTDFIVVGRPITRAENPVAAYTQIRKDFLGE